MCSGSIIALYFSVKSTSLPDPIGPLSSTVKSQTINSIKSANRKVSALLASEYSSKHDSRPSRCLYLKFSPEQKAQVAGYAIESGNKRAIVRNSKQWGVDLNSSIVRTWKAKYEE